MIGITLTANGSMVKTQQLGILNVESTTQFTDVLPFVPIVECRAKIELPIGSQRDRVVTRSAVVHLFQYETVGK
jgi:hypothetical protein